VGREHRHVGAGLLRCEGELWLNARPASGWRGRCDVGARRDASAGMGGDRACFLLAG
jgi:hypothetical protein